MRKFNAPLSTLLLAALIGLLPASAYGAVTGEEIYKEVLESTDIYEDEKLQAYIVKLGEEVVAFMRALSRHVFLRGGWVA